MIDFFDEDFPLTKAQEEELARQAERAAAALEEDREAMNAVAEHELESLSDRVIRRASKPRRGKEGRTGIACGRAGRRRRSSR